MGITVIALHSEIADPLERLAAIGVAAARSKALVSAVGKDITQHVYDLLPAALSTLVTTKVVLPTMNIVVSNVRGPDLPMYLAGARMVAFAPVSIALDGIGLNVTGFSYAGTLWVCAVSCRQMMPDPAFFAACLREAFAELVAAADALPRSAAAAEPVAPAKRKAAARAVGARKVRGGGQQRAPGAKRRSRSAAKTQAP